MERFLYPHAFSFWGSVPSPLSKFQVNGANISVRKMKFWTSHGLRSRLYWSVTHLPDMLKHKPCQSALRKDVGLPTSHAFLNRRGCVRLCSAVCSRPAGTEFSACSETGQWWGSEGRPDAPLTWQQHCHTSGDKRICSAVRVASLKEASRLTQAATRASP